MSIMPFMGPPRGVAGPAKGTLHPMEKLKKAAVYLAAIAVAVAVSGVVRVVVRELLGPSTGGTLDLSDAASRINAMAPMMVDEVTELMNTFSFEDELLVYNYRLVNVDQGTISANDLSVIVNDFQPETARQACSTPELIALFEMGVTLRYAYHYRDRTYISSFDIAPADCGLETDPWGSLAPLPCCGCWADPAGTEQRTVVAITAPDHPTG